MKRPSPDTEMCHSRNHLCSLQKLSLYDDFCERNTDPSLSGNLPTSTRVTIAGNFLLLRLFFLFLEGLTVPLDDACIGWDIFYNQPEITYKKGKERKREKENVRGFRGECIFDSWASVLAAVPHSSPVLPERAPRMPL